MEYMGHRSKKGLFGEGQEARERRVWEMVNSSGVEENDKAKVSSNQGNSRINPVTF